jgi:hypothetical protein
MTVSSGEGQGVSVRGFDLSLSPSIGLSANFSPKKEKGRSVHHGNGSVMRSISKLLTVRMKTATLLHRDQPAEAGRVAAHLP